MEFTTWFLFSGMALVAVISPGPAVLLSVTNSLTRGFGNALVSSLGNITGLFMVSGAAALGLGAVLKTSVLLFTILKISGAAYLIYLGIRQWRSRGIAFGTSAAPASQTTGMRFTQPVSQVFIQGVLVAVSNPKAILFFTALFPQFMDLSRPVGIQFFILTVTFMVYSFIALVFYALSARFTRVWFSRPGRALWFNRISGTVYIAFGLGLLRLKNRTA